MLVYHNPVVAELFSYVNTFVGCFTYFVHGNGKRSELHNFSLDYSAVRNVGFWSKRKGCTTPDQTAASCSNEKSCMFREDMSARF